MTLIRAKTSGFGQEKISIKTTGAPHKDVPVIFMANDLTIDTIS